MRNLSGDSNLPVLKAPAESLGWREICQAKGNQPVMKASAESLSWRGKMSGDGESACDEGFPRES